MGESFNDDDDDDDADDNHSTEVCTLAAVPPADL